MRPRAALAAAALALALTAWACGGESRETVTVFAASSLTDAFTELGEAFEAAHPRAAARFSFAGSAALRTQALEGAPVDVFASASPDEVEALAAAGLVVEQRALAGNRLVVAVAEGANMPCTAGAARAFLAARVPFGPGKAANAGGAAVSGLEQSQNAQRSTWARRDVDDRLQRIMGDIHAACRAAGEQADNFVDYARGANIAGFRKVADAMLAHGDV